MHSHKKKTKPALSIIIISYNTKKLTHECITSILESPMDTSMYEIIVIDNNSPDDSVAMVKNLQKQHDNINLIESKENTGFATANNIAVKQSQGEYVLLLNSDTRVLDNAIEKLLTHYQHNENRIHFLGGKLYETDGKTPQPSAAPFYSLTVLIGFLFLKGDAWGLTRWSPDSEKQADWVSGACILTKRIYYDALQGFDEDIFMYMDEVDLLYRAKHKGFTTWFYPEAKFIHHGSASSGGRSFPVIQAFEGFIFFYKKHHSPFQLLMLQYMLQLKALISLGIGKITHNSYLITTYEQALKRVTMAR